MAILAKFCYDPDILSLLQNDFFGSMAEPDVFRAMFDHLPEVFFFVKDRKSRLIAGSRHLLARLGAASEADLIGTEDEDYFPLLIAHGFRKDDERVFSTGEPVKNRLEVWYNEQHNLDWFLTTKVPLYGKNGQIIGLMGITRRDDGRVSRRPESEVARVLDQFQKQSSRSLSIGELARECGMSGRTLHRKIKEALGVTPHELMLRFRIQNAAEALIRSRTSIGEIALSHGFCDQSAFTQLFHKRTGVTPRQFRIRHQG